LRTTIHSGDDTRLLSPPEENLARENLCEVLQCWEVASGETISEAAG